MLFRSITGEGIDNSPLVEFIKVSFGGVAIGLIIGWLVIKWIKKVFNDEIGRASCRERV